MNENQLSISHDEIIITGKKGPLFIRIFLSIVSFICFMIPVFSGTELVSDLDYPMLAFFALLFFFSFMGLFMLRIVLWNSMGKERLKFKKEYVQYIADYGWFRSKKVSLETDELVLEVLDLNESEPDLGTLRFSNESELIETALELPKEELEKIVQACRARYPHLSIL